MSSLYYTEREHLFSLWDNSFQPSLSVILPSRLNNLCSRKNEVIPGLKHHAMKAYRGSGGKAPYIFNFSTTRK
jgi:hypothetical protein